MYLLKYAGGWTETTSRDPEQLTELAPKHLNDICRRLGGLHKSVPKPLFRLALVSSRFQLAGGSLINILDKNKDVWIAHSGQVFLPRYPGCPPQVHDWFALEMYNSHAELVEKGYGKDVEHDGTMTYYTAEPAWEDGCYEAVMNGPLLPFVFPRSVSTDLIEWGVRAVFERRKMNAAQIVRDRRRQAAIDDERNREALLYELKQKRRVNLGDPCFTIGVDTAKAI